MPWGRAHREGASKRALGAMDDHLLADIGITRDQIPAAVAGLLERAAPPDDTPPAATRATVVERPTACNDAHVREAA